MTATDPDERAKAAQLLAIASTIIALREGKLHACAFPPDATSQADVERRMVNIPARFWRSLLDHEMAQTLSRPPKSAIDAGLCIRLWECLRRRGQPPSSLALAFSIPDICRLWPDVKPPGA